MKTFPFISSMMSWTVAPPVSAWYPLTMVNVTRWKIEGKSFITREGVSMLGISEAAEKLGFRSICVQVDYNKLLEAPLPCIVHWNQQHFVTIYKINNQQVWVADPGAGKLKYTREEFCRCWISSRKNGEDTGVALLLEPTPDFMS